MARLVVVLPLTPLRVGESFTVHDWPLHITVLAPFTTDAAADEITHAIATAVAGQAAITAGAGEGALFGRRHNVPPHRGERGAGAPAPGAGRRGAPAGDRP